MIRSQCNSQCNASPESSEDEATIEETRQNKCIDVVLIAVTHKHINQILKMEL